MRQPPPRRQITDPRALMALAHPIRLALLDYLMTVGPRTASQCAEVVDATPSNCSYHLRHLAKFGLVEPIEASDGRERPWRAAATGFSFGRPGDERPDTATHAAEAALTATRVEENTRLAHALLDRADRLTPAWRAATAFNNYTLRLTPAELTALTESIDRQIRPYVAPIRDDAPDGAELVHLSLQAFKRPETL